MSEASTTALPEPRRILLAVSGGIAAYKVAGAGARAACAGPRGALRPDPRSAARSCRRSCCRPLSGHAVRTRALRRRARRARSTTSRSPTGRELVVVAPATANLLAKLAHGLADDLVSTRAARDARAGPRRAGDEREHVGAPGDTRTTSRALRERGVRFVGPEAGDARLRLGRARAAWPSPRRSRPRRSGCSAAPTLAGEVVLVTAGGTREPLDAVRVLANRSSGKMGFAVAAEAARRGAEVVLIAGRARSRRPRACAASTSRRRSRCATPCSPSSRARASS